VDQSSPSNEAELRSELERLGAKLSTTEDVDIQAALSTRIEQIKSALRANTSSLAEAGDHNANELASVRDGLADLQTNLTTQAEVIHQKLSNAEETELRRELARASAQRYITEDPEVRNQLQARIGELQKLLGIDVNKLAGAEMGPASIQDSTPNRDSPKQSKAKTDLAELQAIVAEKSAQIRRAENSTEIDLPANPEPPTPDEAIAAEKLIQQARVEKMRGNKQEVRRLLEQAVQTAPGSPSVLELLGDDYAERKQAGKALAYYRRASALDPKNVNLERKVAMSALGVDAAGALDQQLQAGIDDGAVPMASNRAALLLSLFLPGLGHIVLGRNTKGWITLSIWCLMLAWAILMGGDIAKLGSMVVGGRSQPNMVVVLPLFVMVVVYFATLADFRGSKETVRKPVEHPRPPVNLPFE
jgi:tetratricopeptide (TPR) repeat protein